MRMRVVVSVIIAAFVVSGARSGSLMQDPAVASDIELYSTWVRAQMAYNNIPGFAIAVVHDSTLVWSAGFGVSDLKSGAPVTPQTVFRIASITKTFTCTAIMQLRDQGKLGLDDPVAKHLSWFVYKDKYPDEPVTIRQLMTHTSGLPRESSFPYWTDHKFPSREEMIEALRNQESIFEPATRYKYSNLGIAILGEVVAAASGMPYEQYIEQNIFRRVGMEASSVVPTAQQKARLATGYARRMPDGTRQVFPLMDAKGITPSANISSTVEDMARYAAAHMQEDRGDDGGLLSAASLREMHRVHWVYPSWQGGYGLGFSVVKTESRAMYGHGGWVGGYRSQLRISPSEKVAVIVMINCDDADPAMFADRAMAMLAPTIAKASAPAAAEEKPDPSWQEYVGRYIDPSGWESEVIVYKGKLMMYDHGYPPEENPVSALTELSPEGPDTFRATGVGASGELVVFERGADRSITRVKVTENYSYRVK